MINEFSKPGCQRRDDWTEARMTGCYASCGLKRCWNVGSKKAQVDIFRPSRWVHCWVIVLEKREIKILCFYEIPLLPEGWTIDGSESNQIAPDATRSHQMHTQIDMQI
jgi:hypothetical protein